MGTFPNYMQHAKGRGGQSTSLCLHAGPFCSVVCIIIYNFGPKLHCCRALIDTCYIFSRARVSGLRSARLPEPPPPRHLGARALQGPRRPRQGVLCRWVLWPARTLRLLPPRCCHRRRRRCLCLAVAVPSFRVHRLCVLLVFLLFTSCLLTGTSPAHLRHPTAQSSAARFAGTAYLWTI